MGDTRRHRGPHPADGELFSPVVQDVLRTAVAELAWLLSRGYARPSALKLVGDRHRLVARQRTAVSRSCCGDGALADRARRCVRLNEAGSGPLMIDGFNLLTTIEAALAGGVLLVGRDGCLRDMASMHGSYRRVEETLPALELVGRTLAERGIDLAAWLLDAPVSNSGRLATIIRELAERRGWDWTVELVPDPDPLLAVSGDLVASADAEVLDRCGRWLNLARAVVGTHVPGANVVDLGTDPDADGSSLHATSA